MIGFNVYFLLAVFLLTGMVCSVWFKKLTAWGAIAGGLCALLAFAGAGFTGIGMMTAFFVAGTAATSWRRADKKKLETTEADHAGRNAGQVLANSGVAAIAGALALLFPAYINWWSLAIAACFSSATADTLASELGTLYGQRFYNIITWKPDQRGLDGVVSLEGTFLGVLGSVLIALMYYAGFGGAWYIMIIVVAGTAGNLADSILGAVLERKGFLKNDAVNFLNTLIAALIAIALQAIFFS
ncbi:DUF92 domain-containing protein [Mucilaginibacter galii]|uniref:DUF92 domain-containing protein n=1 Tax=Mucilaginibacter galii TaxID=2005073 RepID=A0A917N1Q6_9SPHI|nr:DUF92 domain-containing protein [Mucilaginibacter galii]GGI50719.1 hypothetical protein GCM10011425_19310 [Mucilaginibacter galii]